MYITFKIYYLYVYIACLLRVKKEKNMSKFISRILFGVRVYQVRCNGYINVTHLAKAFEKKEHKRRDIHEWLSNKRTQKVF